MDPSLTKTQKVERIQVGSKIWAGLDTFYQGPDLSLSDYPLTPDQLSLNLVEGVCVKRLKRSIEVQFPDNICRKRIVFLQKDICENRNTYVDEVDLPSKAVIVKSNEEIDYLAGLAPPLQEDMERDDIQIITKLRENEYKKALDKLWAENLAFRLNEVEFVPVAILARNLPIFFGTPVHTRKDMSNLSSAEKAELESIREDLNLRFSVKNSLWDNLSIFNGVRVDLLENLSNALAGKKNDGVLNTRIDMPLIFAEKIFLPCLKLTGLFLEEKNPHQFQSGCDGTLMHRLVGSIKGLKVLGIVPSKHPKWKNPYISIKFMTDEEAEISPYFDKFRNKYEGKLPFLVDPNSLAKNAASMPEMPLEVRTELGDDYCYNTSVFKIIHDISVGRLQAARDDDRRNFGVTRWKFLSPESEQLVVDFVKPVEGSATCRLHISGSILSAHFTGNEDIETGLLGEALRDL